jgi:hypothetical protein
MKVKIRWVTLPLVVMVVATIYSSCSVTEDENTVPKQPGGEITKEEADAILDGFSFLRSTKVTGSVPSVTGTTVVKMNSSDTLVIIPKVRIPIRFSHPKGVELGGIFISVKNSTFYYDVPISDREDSDTVSVVIFEIDPAKMDGSSKKVEYLRSFQASIFTYDRNKQPIDSLTRIFSIERLSVDDINCNILTEGHTARKSVG